MSGISARQVIEEERMARLPKWARQRIEVLQRDIAYLNAKLTAGPESNTFADPYSSAPRPLGIGTTIEFRVGDGRWDIIRIRVDGSEIDVNGGLTRLYVRPAASNAVRIGIE